MSEQGTSRLSPDGGAQWLHSVGYGPLDEDDAPEPESCPACDGEGCVDAGDFDTRPCPVCAGYGVVVEGVPG